MTEKKDFKKIAVDILNLIGGKDNISDVYHCATRLRIVVNDPQKVKKMI